jgi:uncharacterized repeat protein (TIGR03803 family)
MARVLPILVLLMVAWSSPAQGQFNVLYTFTGYPDGANPEAGLFLDNVGNLYGTTFYGGLQYDSGTVFKLDTSGVVTVLYAFTGHLDGRLPVAGVVGDSAGNLYGTAQKGALRAGTAFKLDTAGKETMLYTFGRREQAGYPEANFIADDKGNLYSTSYGGGSLGCRYGCGTVFKLTESGKETVLYTFNSSDGEHPVASVIRDRAGNLYGTTSLGGGFGQGVVFKLDKKGRETVLYNFTGGADGGLPNAPVVLDATGSLYGTTFYGGNLKCNPPNGCGTVFKLESTGKETVLYSFSGMPDGAYPEGNLVRDAKGDLYGVTLGGGEYGNGCPSDNNTGCGIVFKVDTIGSETVLYTFTGSADGGNPQGGLISDGNGTLYGTTNVGGTFNSPCTFEGCGVVFKVTPH